MEVRRRLGVSTPIAKRMAEVVPTVLVDSVIMIDHFNGIPAATTYLLEMQGKLAISVITRAEVLTGFEGKERQLGVP